MTTAPESERVEELAALAALGLASEAELGELGALADAPGGEVAATMRSFADAAAALALALAPVDPPAGAWQVITGRIAEAAPRARGSDSLAAVTVTDELAVRRGRGRAGWIAAAVASLAAAALALAWLRASGDVVAARDALADRDRSLAALRTDRDVLRDQLAGVAADRDRLAGQLAPVRSPTLALASMRGDGGGQARILADATHRRWLVMAFELPAEAGKDYQLWYVPAAGAPISAGLLRNDPDGVWSAVIDVPAGLGEVRPAISLEPAGGSPQPTAVKMIGEPI